MDPKRTFLVATVVALFSPAISTHAQTPASVTSINSYTAEVNRFVKVNKKHRIFADVASEDNDKESWKEFKSKKAFNDTDSYQSALVWSRNGKVVVANFSFSSPSGDWAHYISYYFRDDGSLAKIEATLNTFYGDISVVRHSYYDSNGKPLKSTKKFLDLKTRQPKKPVEFMENPVPVYLNVSGLPFSKLL